MKTLRLLTAIIVGLTLTSCGGGGGGGVVVSTPATLYVGLTAPATITSVNAMPFFNMVFGDTLTPPDINIDNPPAAAALSAARQASSEVLAANVETSSVPVSGSVSGSVSGTMSYTGDINPDLTGTLTFIFMNFNDGDGYTYDGKLVISILSVNAATFEITHSVITLWSLMNTTANDQFTLSGTLETFYDIAAVTLTDIFNVDGRNEKTDETFRYENIIYSMTCNTAYMPTYCTQDVSGKIYLEAYGYIDINLDSPLVYNYPGQFNIDVPDTGGPVTLSGELQTGIRIVPLSIAQVQVDIDLDEDPEYELTSIYNWSEIVGLVITWEKTFGLIANFDVALSAVETTDGGFVAAGWSNTNTTNRVDIMLLKTDVIGETEWTSYLGGTDNDEAQSVRQTPDNGFVVAGFTSSGSTNYRGIVYKVDTNGNETWNQPLSSDPESRAYDIQLTSDGGYIVTGYRRSSPTVGFGWEDLYLVKLDQNGVIEWEKVFGGIYADIGYSVIEVTGGGFVIVGTTELYSDGFDQNIYLVRTDASGNLIWERNFGDTWTQYGYDLLEDVDGSFLISGNTYTLQTGYAYSLHKVDTDGNLTLSTTFGSTTSYYTRNSITSSGDGGYVIAATDTSDAQLFKLDATGNLVWQKTFNWSPFSTQCTATSVEKTLDGGFIIGGSAWPGSGKDFYLIKTDADGNL